MCWPGVECGVTICIMTRCVRKQLPGSVWAPSWSPSPFQRVWSRRNRCPTKNLVKNSIQFRANPSVNSSLRNSERSSTAIRACQSVNSNWLNFCWLIKGSARKRFLHSRMLMTRKNQSPPCSASQLPIVERADSLTKPSFEAHTSALPTCQPNPILRYEFNKFRLGHTKRTILSALRR